MKRTMKVMFKRVAGLSIAMYETRICRADGSVFRNEIVDMQTEVVWC